MMDCKDDHHPFRWDIDMNLWREDAIYPAPPSFEVMYVDSSGDCYKGGDWIGITDPRRLEEIGEREIYRDGEVVSTFFNYFWDPDHFALAE